MEKNHDIKDPRYNEPIFPVPWDLVTVATKSSSLENTLDGSMLLTKSRRCPLKTFHILMVLHSSLFNHFEFKEEILYENCSAHDW